MSKLSLILGLALGVVSCAGSPHTVAQEHRLGDRVEATLSEMRARDPGLEQVLRDTYAYAVFPDVGNAGVFYVGGAYGNGILYVQGRPTGLVELKQGSVGLELGGQTFAELVVLRDPHDVEHLENGNFDVGAGASATALTAGAAGAAEFRNGMAVFVMPRGGLMAGITVTGQTIDYHPWIARR